MRAQCQVRDANNTFQLAADPGPCGENGAYFIGGRKSRPVAAAADEKLQDAMWKLWEEQCCCAFRL